MSTQDLTYTLHPGPAITPPMLAQSAALLSSHYGIWGPLAKIPGARVKMSPARLKQQCLTPGEGGVMIRCVEGEELVGHVCATRWRCCLRSAGVVAAQDDDVEQDVESGKENAGASQEEVCWITQLCVARPYRQRGIATAMLRLLSKTLTNITVWGIMSSHPAALMSALRAFGPGLGGIDMHFIRRNAGKVMSTSTVGYVRAARLGGRLFDVDRGSAPELAAADDEDTGDGALCVADTAFWVDHTEPLGVLDAVREARGWPLGELREGCEWVVLVEGRRDE